MDKSHFLNLLDELLELEPGTLNGTEQVADLEAWNSISVIGFMALVNEQFGIIVSPRQIASCSTVNDLVTLAFATDSPA